MNKCLIFNVDKGQLLRRPLGAYRIAHILRENNWDAEVIDFVIYWNLDQLKQLARQRFTPDVKWIGLSYLFLSTPIDTIDQFCMWVKEEYPDIKILVGSPSIYTHQSKYVDYNINGFGELALIELLKYLFSNGPTPKFSLSTNAGKQISANSMYPAYPMKSLNVIYEDRDFIQPEEWLGVEFSRGCMFACAFCNYPVLGVKGDYTRDADDFEIQMRDAYDRFGVQNYYVADETFNDRTEKVTKFANVVEKLNFKPFFTGCVRADLMISRPQDKEELLRMGFLAHLYGVETFHHQAGKAVGKGMDPIKMKEGLVTVRKYFETHGTKQYRATISLIVGLPYEPISSVFETKDWLLENWQGQSFNILPLEVPISEFDNPSKIGLNWKKYNYEDASNDPTINCLTPMESVWENIFAKKYLIWKNEHTNIKEASEVADTIAKENFKPGNDFRIGNYALLKLGLPSDLNERLALAAGDQRLMHHPAEFISSYIEKKLNL